jgi:hypothetical protein
VTACSTNSTRRHSPSRKEIPLDAQTAVILGALISGVALLASQAITQITGIVRSRSNHAHELRRDRQAKYYDFRLQEYRDRREACESLLAATNQQSILASTWKTGREALALPRTAESLAAAAAEAQLFTDSRNLGAKYADHALQRLGVDERAAGVLDAYYSLPFRRLVETPDDKDVKRDWREAREALRRAIFAYLHMLEEQLRADDTSESPSRQS